MSWGKRLAAAARFRPVGADGATTNALTRDNRTGNLAAPNDIRSEDTRTRGQSARIPTCRPGSEPMEGARAPVPARPRCAHRLRYLPGEDLGARIIRALHCHHGPFPCGRLAGVAVYRGGFGDGP